MATDKSGLLASAFPSGKQKGVKSRKGTGETGEGDTQHGELAGNKKPKKNEKIPGQKTDTGSSRKPSGDFSQSRNGAEEPEKKSKIPKRAGDHSVAKVLDN